MNAVTRKYIEENLFGNNIPEGTAEENWLGLCKEWDEENLAITFEDLEQYFEEMKV